MTETQINHFGGENKFSHIRVVFRVISSFSSPDLDYSGAWGDSVDCDTQEARHGHTGVRGAVRDVAWLPRPRRRTLWRLHPQPVFGGEISQREEEACPCLWRASCPPGSVSVGLENTLKYCAHDQRTGDGWMASWKRRICSRALKPGSS